LSLQHHESSTSLRLIQSFRTRSGEFLDGSVRSEGDLDSFVDSCGFLDWPTAKEDVEVGGEVVAEDAAGDTIQEEHREEEGEEEWNIEDYEGPVIHLMLQMVAFAIAPPPTPSPTRSRCLLGSDVPRMPLRALLRRIRTHRRLKSHFLRQLARASNKTI
jgi:hypothetical protein